MSGFRRNKQGHPALALDDLEREVLADLVRQVRELIGGPDEADPLAGLLQEDTDRRLPDDPALARLLPDAYGDDPEGADDFRRFTEADLRAGKVRDALAVISDLDSSGSGAPVVLASEDSVDSWLRALNDVRLSLGARLDVDEDSWEEMEALPVGSPRRQALELYHWLGWLQESLLSCL